LANSLWCNSPGNSRGRPTRPWSSHSSSTASESRKGRGRQSPSHHHIIIITASHQHRSHPLHVSIQLDRKANPIGISLGISGGSGAESNRQFQGEISSDEIPLASPNSQLKAYGVGLPRLSTHFQPYTTHIFPLLCTQRSVPFDFHLILHTRSICRCPYFSTACH